MGLDYEAYLQGLSPKESTPSQTSVQTCEPTGDTSHQTTISGTAGTFTFLRQGSTEEEGMLLETLPL